MPLSFREPANVRPYNSDPEKEWFRPANDTADNSFEPFALSMLP